jgi:hypothetical protein
MNNFTKLYRSFAAGAVALTMTATSAWAEGSIVSFNGPAWRSLYWQVHQGY